MVEVTLKDYDKTKVLIAKAGFGVRGFADNIGISNAYLSQILNGRRRPSPTIAKKIATGLEMDIMDIFLIKVVDTNDQTSKRSAL